MKSLGNLGEHIEGRKISEKIVKINPLDDMAWNNIGASYGELGEYNKAIEFCTKALSINPSNIKAKNNIQRYSQLRTNQK